MAEDALQSYAQPRKGEGSIQKGEDGMLKAIGTTF